jgi:TPR repeat protein
VTEKVNFQIVPVQDGASIAQSEVRSSLIARGRKDASTLLTGRPKLKLPAASYYVGKSGLIDRGDAFTQFQIGYAYQNGLGIPQDYALAVEWYLKSAKQGMGRAQWKLGILYRDGEGVPQNGAKAALWLRRAAEKDFPSAEYDLGKMYDLGLGVPKDYVQAEQWYHRAAEHGYSLAQFNLGLLYANGGEGLSQNNAEAYFWLVIAATETSKNSIEKSAFARSEAERYAVARDAAAAKLTQTELSEVQRRANRWLAMKSSRK